MMVEAIYRDGHKEKFLAPPEILLGKVVDIAKEAYGRSQIKHLRIVPNARNNGPKR